MTSKRRDQILAEIVGSISPEVDPARLSGLCAEVTGMNGAGIMLMSDDAQWRSFNTSDQVSARLDELQLAYLEGSWDRRSHLRCACLRAGPR